MLSICSYVCKSIVKRFCMKIQPIKYMHTCIHYTICTGVNKHASNQNTLKRTSHPLAGRVRIVQILCLIPEKYVYYSQVIQIPLMFLTLIFNKFEGAPTLMTSISLKGHTLTAARIAIRIRCRNWARSRALLTYSTGENHYALAPKSGSLATHG